MLQKQILVFFYNILEKSFSAVFEKGMACKIVY